jgi:Uncharacterized protein conserved in bacteria
MDFSVKAKTPLQTKPIFEQNAIEIAKQMSSYSAEELSEILKVNNAIGEENRVRYKYFGDKKTPQKEAILAYNGIVFKKLGVEDFSKEDFLYAQDHLRITSFCYGILRPLDLIYPYRLEGNVVLPTTNKSMFNYWKDKLTDTLIKDTTKVGGVLYNLASAEMKKLFDWKRIEKELTVISPEFKIIKTENQPQLLFILKWQGVKLQGRLLKIE